MCHAPSAKTEIKLFVTVNGEKIHEETFTFKFTCGDACGVQ